MQETLRDHHTSISIGVRLRFADDIDLMSGSSGELHDLTNRLVDRATANGKEVSTEKRKIMNNSRNNNSADISRNGPKLEEVWLVHVTCHDSLSNTILQDTLEDRQRRGRRRKCWMNDIKEWTSLSMPELLPEASCRNKLEESLC